MGESKLRRLGTEKMLLSCAGVRTAGGRVRVRWEADSAATPMGQLAYFIEFLTLSGRWSGWRDRCPLSYTSPNAPSKADVLGTWMLSILWGHRRYSHVTTIRCDGVNPALLAMKPDEYHGGAQESERLWVQAVKLEAGDLVLSASSSLQRITPMPRGTRIASASR